jgi:cbb3-type cytochrome oxidase subunit 3
MERSMDIFKAISLIALFILLIALLFIHFNNRKVLAKLEERRVLASAKLDLMELDNELSNWLYALGLPQLEGEKKRHEMACRLRTILIEKLLRQKVPRKTLREELTEAFYSRDRK